MRARNLSCILATLSILLSTRTLSAQGTAFTYQGRLNVGAGAANGSYDLIFALFSTSSGVGQVGSTLTSTATPVSNGLFTVTLDFGNEFPGSDRWLEIAVRTNGGGAFVTLTPRQKITATPYAIRAATADAAGLTGAIPSSSLSGSYTEPLTFDNAGNSYSGTFYGQFLGLNFIGGSFAGSFIGNGSGLANLNGSQILSGTIPSAVLNNAWRPVGNSGTIPGTHFIGNTDNKPLEFRVNNQRVFKIDTNANGAPNFLAGSPANSIGTNVEGATIAGGGLGSYPNTIAANYATIGGGTFHTVGGEWSTIAGGRDNVIQADHSTIAGGRGNTIRPLASYGTIAGGVFNTIDTNADYSTVSGGYLNDVGTNSLLGAIGGGYENNIANNSSGSTIAGGYFNDIGTNSSHGAIGGGYNNNIAEDSAGAAIGGGYNNTVLTNGHYAMIPGGELNSAAAYAFAAGRYAKANHQGAFVWADATGLDLTSTNANSVTLRAAGGYRLFSDSGATAGVFLAPGGTSWAVISDRNAKKDFAAVDSRIILEKLAKLPITQWHYRWEEESATPHIGPMAQDFKAAFYPSRDDKSITTQEADGVALAAIQGLNQKVESTTAALREELMRRDKENLELRQRLSRLESLLEKQATH